jgi:uncharacterized membrane protein
MKIVQGSQLTCVVCGKPFGSDELASGATVRTVIGDLIRRDHPQWSAAARICRSDLARYGMEYLEALLHLEHGEVTSLGREAIQSLQSHGVLAANVESAFEKDWTIGQRLADRLLKIGGGRIFTACFGAFLGSAILLNAVALYFQPAHSYLIVLATLILVTFAAIQAPMIIFSQMRNGSKDRLRSEHNYLMTLKSELGLRHLNTQVDALVSDQRQLLIELQQTLMVILARPGAADQQRPVKSA